MVGNAAIAAKRRAFILLLDRKWGRVGHAILTQELRRVPYGRERCVCRALHAKNMAFPQWLD